MEAILMKGVKGLDERATAALGRKADAGALQVRANMVNFCAESSNRRENSDGAIHAENLPASEYGG